MNYEESKHYINSNPQLYLERDRTKKGYICPLCGSGSGKSGTGLATKDGIHWKCFNGNCNFYGDMIELIAQENGIKDGGSREAFDKAREAYGIEVSGDSYYVRAAASDFDDISAPKVVQTERDGKAASDPEANKKHIYECMLHIEETDYFSKRGIATATAKSYFCGFNPQKQNIVIPTHNDRGANFIERNIHDKRFFNNPGGNAGIFNTQALKGSTPIFITEAAIDALSIIEAGGQAVSINGATNAPMLITMIKQMSGTDAHPQHCYISMDNDKAGETAANTLLEALKNIGWSCSIVNVSGEHKDANEALMADREKLREAVAGALANVEAVAESNKCEPISKYMEKFWAEIKDSVNHPPKPTGFPSLDRALVGGLYDGFYVLGAVSSLGKTTLMLQIADQVAESGDDVIIFSLEMSKHELVAKSISRLTAKEVLEERGYLTKSECSSQIEVTQFGWYNTYGEYKRELIYKASNQYEEFCGNLYIVQGVGNIGVNEIRRTVEQHISSTGKRPLVIVDYLQIIAPYVDPENPHKSLDPKQSMDKNVLELKRISRDFRIPLFTISSFNRQNYTKDVAHESFKESGAIEYTADVLLGLQYDFKKGEDGRVSNKERAEAMSRNPREISLTILKNRKGISGKKLRFFYSPAYNLFVERESDYDTLDVRDESPIVWTEIDDDDDFMR